MHGRVRDRVPAVRKIEHTIEYLDLVGSCHQFVATLGRLVPRLRGQEFSDDEREHVRRGVTRVRTAADWLEAAMDRGNFTSTSNSSSSSKVSDRGRQSPAGRRALRRPGPAGVEGSPPHRTAHPPVRRRNEADPVEGRPRRRAPARRRGR
ncbi:DUF6192 family protein [Streptomyces stramineus]|uniref:DUF6192 family protein n=1 Tax=Streptomyces TaxID=1883 RepID=UPI0031CF7766